MVAIETLGESLLLTRWRFVEAGSRFQAPTGNTMKTKTKNTKQLLDDSFTCV